MNRTALRVFKTRPRSIAMKWCIFHLIHAVPAWWRNTECTGKESVSHWVVSYFAVAIVLGSIGCSLYLGRDIPLNSNRYTRKSVTFCTSFMACWHPRWWGGEGGSHRKGWGCSSEILSSRCKPFEANHPKRIQNRFCNPRVVRRDLPHDAENYFHVKPLVKPCRYINFYLIYLIHYTLCKSLLFTYCPGYSKDMFTIRSSSYNLRSNHILALPDPKNNNLRSAIFFIRS